MSRSTFRMMMPLMRMDMAMPMYMCMFCCAENGRLRASSDR